MSRPRKARSPLTDQIDRHVSEALHRTHRIRGIAPTALFAPYHWDVMRQVFLTGLLLGIEHGAASPAVADDLRAAFGLDEHPA